MQSNEHKKSSKILFCETCKKEICNNTKSSHTKSTTLIQNEVFSRKYRNLTVKINRHLNPDFEKVYDSVKRVIDDCMKHFHRFK